MTVTPPHFDALAVFKCKRNRLYRIYVRPQELVFIWAGSGSEGVMGARAAAFSQRGVVGILLASLIGKALVPIFDPGQKNRARLAVIDQQPLEVLIDDHPYNLRAAISGFDEVRIAPRSKAHAYAYSDHGHQALLYLRHRTLGRYRLGIASLRDAQIAITELPRVLGNRCRVELPWPEKEQPCGCAVCRRARGER